MRLLSDPLRDPTTLCACVHRGELHSLPGDELGRCDIAPLTSYYHSSRPPRPLPRPPDPPCPRASPRPGRRKALRESARDGPSPTSRPARRPAAAGVGNGAQLLSGRAVDTWSRGARPRCFGGIGHGSEHNAGAQCGVAGLVTLLVTFSPGPW